MAAEPTLARPSAGPSTAEIDTNPAAIATGAGPRERNAVQNEERSTMGIEIRPFEGTREEYEAIIAIENDVYPDYPGTVEEWQHWDRNRDPKHHHERAIAYDAEGKALAFCSAQHYGGMFHPRKLGLGFTVLRAHQHEGIGSEMYTYIRRRLEHIDPITLWSDAREDYDSGRAFLGKLGFEEVQREWENHLDLKAFEPNRFEGAIERAEASGLRLATYAELIEEDPDFWPRLYDMCDTVSRDVPSPDAHTPVDPELWRKRTEGNPNLMPEGYFVAVDGDRYVGLSNLWKLQADPNAIETGLTGVRREHRRRGVALALKLKALGWAKEQGYDKVKTWNERGNEGMLAINEMLGFVKQPAWISYALELKPDPDAETAPASTESAETLAATGA